MDLLGPGLGVVYESQGSLSIGGLEPLVFPSWVSAPHIRLFKVVWRDGRWKERLVVTLGRTMFIHNEGALLLPTCAGDQNACRRR